MPKRLRGPQRLSYPRGVNRYAVALAAFFGVSACTEDPSGNPAPTTGGAGGAPSLGGDNSGWGGARPEGGGGGTTASSPLGRACETDTDCGEMTCLKASDTVAEFSGGPAGGYCSTQCRKDADCGEGGLCFRDAAEGICVLECSLGPDIAGINEALRDEKCHGREDLRCQSVGVPSICLPTCGIDGQCPAGRYCDPLSRACIDEPSSGDPLGTACDPSTPECSGTCLQTSSGNFCSELCVLGGVLVDTFDCGGIEQGLCVYSDAGKGAGDQAFCAAACLAHDDCLNPGYWCFGVGGVTGVQIDNGFCFGAVDCEENAFGCSVDQVCTETQFGKYCLDTRFALTGTGGQGGAGGSDTGGGSPTGGSGGAGGSP